MLNIKCPINCHVPNPNNGLGYIILNIKMNMNVEKIDSVYRFRLYYVKYKDYPYANKESYSIRFKLYYIRYKGNRLCC